MGRFCLVTKNRELSNFEFNKKLYSIEVCKSFSVLGMTFKECVIFMKYIKLVYNFFLHH